MDGQDARLVLRRQRDTFYRCLQPSADCRYLGRGRFERAGPDVHVLLGDPLTLPAIAWSLEMLEAVGLTKRYNGIPAVLDVSFHIQRGQVLGYLGPNGSGKSTTVKMLTGLIAPSTGQMFFDGARIHDGGPAFCRKLGYVPE